MSIHNIIDKIKSLGGVDNTTIMFLFIIVGVGIGAFGLGRISSNNKPINNTSNSSYLVENDSMPIEPYIEESETTINKQAQFKERRYVASKNGKIYYSIGCSGAKRIKPENEIWFETTIDAEKSGFKASTSCK